MLSLLFFIRLVFVRPEIVTHYFFSLWVRTSSWKEMDFFAHLQEILSKITILPYVSKLSSNDVRLLGSAAKELKMYKNYPHFELVHILGQVPSMWLQQPSSHPSQFCLTEAWEQGGSGRKADTMSWAQDWQVVTGFAGPWDGNLARQMCRRPRREGSPLPCLASPFQDFQVVLSISQNYTKALLLVMVGHFSCKWQLGTLD